MKMPISQPGGARFRGPTSSALYNKNEDDKYYDLLELFHQSNLNEKDLKEAYEVLLAENISMHQYINMLENRISNLEKKLGSIGDSSWYNGQFFKTGYIDMMTNRYPNAVQDQDVKSIRSHIDLDHRFATLPIVHQIPKTHMIREDGTALIPDELKVNIYRTNTKGTVIENDIYNAFDGNNETYWKRHVVYPINESPDYEDAIIEIELPLKMVNNLNVNTITIHPHPERGVKIQNIEVEYNNGWKQIPGFYQNEISVINASEYSGRKKWFFPNRMIKRIRITLRQNNPFNIEGQHVFVLGAQEIGVYLTIFDQSGSFVLTPIDMSDVGVYNIEYVEHQFLNRSAFSYSDAMEHMLEGNIYTYEILKEDSNGILTIISNSEWNNQTTKKLWVKTNLFFDPNPNNGVNPCLHAVRVHYTKV